VTYGLLGAGLVALAAALLLAFGGGPRRRHGAALAAWVGAFAIVVPIVLAWLGTDYLVARNLIAAWLPVAIVIAAACTAPRTLPFGVVLAVLFLGAFVYANVKINGSPQYERPDWRGVARALGTAKGRRAIVAYDSSYATQPLSLYVPRVPWSQRIAAPVGVGEVDVVANAYSSPAVTLPPGVRRISTATVGDFLVARFAVSPVWRGTPATLGARAGALVPGGAQPAVLIQPG
jgi:hypothetical protein